MGPWWGLKKLPWTSTEKPSSKTLKLKIPSPRQARLKAGSDGQSLFMDWTYAEFNWSGNLNSKP